MFARGKHAIAICQRSGKKVPYRELVDDGYIPGLRVARDERDEAHPQERPVRTKEGIALRRPSPETATDEVAYNAAVGYNDAILYNGGETSLADALFPGQPVFGGGT